MKRSELRAAGVNTKLIVVLVILVIVAAVVWGVRLFRHSGAEDEFLKGPFVLWCSECDKEFTFETRKEALAQRTQEVDGEKMVVCPECGKPTARWSRRPADQGARQGVRAVRP